MTQNLLYALSSTCVRFAMTQTLLTDPDSSLDFSAYFAMHIRDKLAGAKRTKQATFSFEFFPPKTEQVREIDRLGPRSTNEMSRVFKTSMIVC